MAQHQHYATGKRKTSIARVFLKTGGSGKMTINKKSLEDFFGRETDRMIVTQPLQLLDLSSNFDFYITVKGGGTSGQAGAIRHGISKVLVVYDEATTVQTDDEEGGEGGIESYRRAFRREGLLTRDARKVERKKVGLRKARKKPQFSKR